MKGKGTAGWRQELGWRRCTLHARLSGGVGEG